jgi:glutamyl/glutaminyl-tRNA synthetase
LWCFRVEDTDQARSTRESEQAVITDLEWLGIKWDEGRRPLSICCTVLALCSSLHVA